MKHYIFKQLIAEGFKSIGTNKINHSSIIRCFVNNKTDSYVEIYKEFWGYSLQFYGKGFMNGYHPTCFDVTENKDITALRSYIKKVFTNNGFYKNTLN